MTTIQLRTSGTHCGSCAMLIEMAVSELPGVETVKASHPDNLATVTFDPEKIGPAEIVAAIRQAGYDAEVTG